MREFWRRIEHGTIKPWLRRIKPWRAKTFGRGMKGHNPFFHVIEFWLENRLMIEVATPAMVREYLDFLKGFQTATMSDPESIRLMRATH